MLLAVMLMVVMNTNVVFAGIDPEHEGQIDRAVAAAFELEMTPGAVVFAGRADGLVFQKAYGHMTYAADAKPMTADTVFDLASLSKTIGCATSIMILAERGKLDVHDPVSKYIPGMDSDDKRDITIEQCLLHRAGFVGDNPMKDFKDGPEAALKKIYSAKLKYKPGTDFVYSDNSMIVLGEVVKAVSGQPLDVFATENIFKPLKMEHTAYNPPKEWRDHIAPTEKRAKGDKDWIVGEVQDPRALVLGGVAGHAGVFASAGDVARFCRMMLNKGELDGVRILSEKTIGEMIKPRSMTTPEGDKIARAYGFDVDTPASGGPRGKRFAKGKSFGHTGYTGTSYWIDPSSDGFVVILTNRVHPDDDAEIKMLRKRVATIVGDALIAPRKSNSAG
jgi:CubicO group peptidase (beta-lactamase class C family)